jgi:hypothetical protein
MSVFGTILFYVSVNLPGCLWLCRGVVESERLEAATTTDRFGSDG